MKNLRWRIFNEDSFTYNKLLVIQSKNNKKRIAEINRKDQNWFSLHKLGIGKWTSLKRVHQVLWWKGSACLHHGLLLKCTPPTHTRTPHRISIAVSPLTINTDPPYKSRVLQSLGPASVPPIPFARLNILSFNCCINWYCSFLLFSLSVGY